MAYGLRNLDALEAEAIHVIREVAAEFVPGRNHPRPWGTRPTGTAGRRRGRNVPGGRTGMEPAGVDGHAKLQERRPER